MERNIFSNRRVGATLSRLTILLFTVAFVFAPVSISLAQTFPTKPVRIIVPAEPGGGLDIPARNLAQGLSQRFGQQVIVENIVGASQQRGVHALVKAQPDGYTLLYGGSTPITIAENFDPKPPYDARRELIGVAVVARNPRLIVIPPDVKANTLPEFFALARTQPGKFFYGSPGIGHSFHLLTELLSTQAGIKMTHVPYKGSAQTLVALLGGDLMIAIAGVTTMREHVNSGKVRLLAASTRERDPLAPTVPSAAEFGHPELDYAGDLGYFLPAGAPRPVVIKLADALGKAIQGPEFAARATALGTQVKYRNPEQFAELVAASYSRYQRIVKQAGIKPD